MKQNLIEMKEKIIYNLGPHQPPSITGRTARQKLQGYRRSE